MATENDEIGSHTQLPTSVAKVSYWHIPRHVSNDHARIREMYFDDMNEALIFEAVNSAAPELAMLLPIIHQSKFREEPEKLLLFERNLQFTLSG